LLFLCLFAFGCGIERDPGVLVLSVNQKAGGIEPGDLVLGWRPQVDSERSPESFAPLYSPLEWDWHRREVAASGPLVLSIRRDGRVVEVTGPIPAGISVVPVGSERVAVLLDRIVSDKRPPGPEDPVWAELESTANSDPERRWAFYRASELLAEEEPERALVWLERAIALGGETDRERNLLLEMKGNLAHDLDNFKSASLCFVEICEMTATEWPDSLARAQGLNDLGVVQRKLGNIDAAEHYYSEALAMRRRLVPDSLAVAESLGNLGTLARRNAQYDRSREFQTEALEIRQRLDPGTRLIENSLNSLGVLALSTGQLELAEARFGEVRTLVERRDPGGLHWLLNNQGSTESRQAERLAGKKPYLWGKHLRRSREYHSEALAQRREKGLSFEVSQSLNNLGDVAMLLGERREAESLHREALEIRREISEDSLEVAFSSHNLGVLLSGDPARLAEARESLGTALEIRRRRLLGSGELAATLHEIALIDHQEGGYAAALRAFSEAAEHLEAQVDRLGVSHDAEARYRGQARGLYSDWVHTLVRSGMLEDALAVMERSKARSFLTLLRERDFLSQVPEELLERRRANGRQYEKAERVLRGEHDADRMKEIEGELRQLRLARDEVNARIRDSLDLEDPSATETLSSEQRLSLAGDEHTAVISYQVGDDRTQILAWLGDGPLQAHTIEASSRELSVLAHRLRKNIRAEVESSEARHFRNEAERAAADLFERILGPVWRSIEGASHLVILPDGPLNEIPFAALKLKRDGSEGEEVFLVEEASLSFGLSLEVVRRARRAGCGENLAQPSSVVAFGEPVYRSEPELPGTAAELVSIAASFPGRVVEYRREEANETRAKQIDPDTTILHLAMHAEADPLYPLNGRLFFSDLDERTLEDGSLRAWEIMDTLRLNGTLVTLSACETALGAEVPGEGVFGLVRAFLYAGASGTVGTLWRVGDSESTSLIADFYEGLAGGHRPAAALAQAQRKAIRSENDSAVTPLADWAGVQYFGCT